MSAGKTIILIPTIIMLALFVYVALNLKNNSPGVIGAVILEPGFHNVQPQINGRHYHSDGTYNINFRSYSEEQIKITEIKLIEKASGRECNTTLISKRQTIEYKDIINVTARCSHRTTDDVYLLSAEINYRIGDSEEIHQETGDMMGDVEI